MCHAAYGVGEKQGGGNQNIAVYKIIHPLVCFILLCNSMALHETPKCCLYTLSFSSHWFPNIRYHLLQQGVFPCENEMGGKKFCRHAIELTWPLKWVIMLLGDFLSMVVSSNLYTAYQSTEQHNLLHTCPPLSLLAQLLPLPVCSRMGKRFTGGDMSAHLHKVSHFSVCPILLFLLQNLCLIHVLVDQMKGYSTLHQFIECEASWGTRRKANDIVHD